MKLQEFMIVDRQHLLLDGLHGEGPDLIEAIESYLTTSAVPGVTWFETSVSPGVMKELFGKRRDFLVIEFKTLAEYRVLVTARDYGTALEVAWFLTGTARLSKDIGRTFRFDGGDGGRYDVGAELDVFDWMDLASFVSLTRHALKQAVNEITGKDGPTENEPGSW